MPGPDQLLDELRSEVTRRMLDNLLFSPRARLPNQAMRAAQIYKEGLAHKGGDDGGDAMRHAETSRRLATEIGPITARLGGLAVEAAGFHRPLLGTRSLAEEAASARMDLHNNEVGLRAAMARRPVDPRLLQTTPKGARPPLD